MSDARPQLFELLQQLLPGAQAESLHVVATFLDIRGFSSFTVRGGSFDTAFYLRSVYSTILKERFPDRDFFKSTGDGLMLIHHLPPETNDWPNVLSSIVRRTCNLVNDFSQLTDHDYAVVPPVPQHLGVGVARGNATRLVSGGVTLDYTGPCLNLAARLMDKARPSGVVFADTHPEAMLGEELGDFNEDAVCIRGISEEVPITIYATPDVKIQQRDREPLSGLRRVWSEERTLSVTDVRKYQTYPFHLPRRPSADEAAEVRVSYHEFKNGKIDGSYYFEESGELEESTYGTWLVRLSLERTRQMIENTPEKTEHLGGLIHSNNSVSFRAFIRPIDEQLS